MVALNNRARDGQPQPAMFTEILGWRALTVEPAEDRFSFLRWNAGAFVADANNHFLVGQRSRYFHHCAGRRKGHRVIDQIGKHTFEADIFTHDRGDCPPWPCEGDVYILVAATVFARLKQLFNHIAQVDRFELCLCQLGIHAACV